MTSDTLSTPGIQTGHLMNRSWTAVILLVAALVGVVAYQFWSSDADPTLRGDASGATAGPQMPTASVDSPPGSPTPLTSNGVREPSTAQAYLEPQPLESLMDHTPRPAADLPQADRYEKMEALTHLDARSPAEAQWLAQRGYPDGAAGLAALQALSDVELAELAASGDLAAQAVLGLRQADRREVVKGYSNLSNAAARGSTYALLAYADSQSRAGNMIEALAWYKLAILRGDYRAARVMGAASWPTLTPFQVSSAELYAIRYYQNLLDLRRQLGYGAFDNTLRPGFAEPQPRVGDTVGVFDQPGH